MAARKLRPLRKFDPSASRELLPWALADWPSWDHQIAFLWMFRRKGCLGWDTYKVLHGSGISGRAHSIHRSLFLLQVHYEVLAGTQKAGEGLRTRES